mgnify:FL=1
MLTIGEIGDALGVAILAGRGAIWVDTWLRARNKVDQKTIDAMDQRLRDCERKSGELTETLKAHVDTLKRIGDACSTEMGRINRRIGDMELAAIVTKTRSDIVWELVTEDRRQYKRRGDD